MLNRYKLSTSRADGFLVWIETERRDGKKRVTDNTERILKFVRSVNDGSRVWGVVFGYRELKPLYLRLFGLGVETLYEVHSNELSSYLPEEYAGAISSISKRIEPAVVLFPDSLCGKELAGRVAGILDAGVVAGCSRIEMDSRNAVAVTESGDFSYRGFPQIATIADDGSDIGKVGNGAGTVIYWNHRCRFGKKVLEIKRRS